MFFCKCLDAPGCSLFILETLLMFASWLRVILGGSCTVTRTLSTFDRGQVTVMPAGNHERDILIL